jgi:hypothetical protein
MSSQRPAHCSPESGRAGGDDVSFALLWGRNFQRGSKPNSASLSYSVKVKGKASTAMERRTSLPRTPTNEGARIVAGMRA